MMARQLAKITISSLAIAAAIQTANAETLRIEVNKASILQLNETPTTIIIGNPALADVTPQDNNLLVLVGKASGRTNIIILDAAGNIMHNYDIAVQEEQSGNLTMFRAGAQWTYSCSPYCERVVNPNDDPEAFGANLGQVMSKMQQMTVAAQEAAASISSEVSSTISGGVASTGGITPLAQLPELQTFTILPPD
ncbi:MAG: pilus assembly protein N-terminal domain-containing protein [Rhizobiales bacterium]|nr:pilus assembly protein N-terminal domain-containing protein [Hyphomicrobiales bacterium]NRB14272.1 pilus assembly protein N-terminal domain-containing protein [Hyphomicrobiales bacterium]